MSRSRMKHPMFVDRSSKKLGKRLASRAVRRAKDVPNGKGYRKYFESWNICDFKLPTDFSFEKKPWKRGMK